VDVSGQDYKAQENMKHEIAERRKSSKSLATQILSKLIPDNIDFNYYTMLTRTSSLMIRQNAKLMTQLMKPDILVDIQMSRYGSFDYDKSERLIAIGRQKTQKAVSKFKSPSRSSSRQSGSPSKPRNSQ
jgi:NTE family protein